MTQLPWHLLGLIFVLAGLIFGCTVPPVGGETQIHTFARFAGKQLNDAFLILGIGTLLYLARRGKSRPELMRLLTVMLTITVIVQLIQKVTFYGFHILPRPSGTDGGFPSGHAAASCALALLLTERLPKGAPIWYALAGLITWSRVETGAHYPYQIVSGAILGIVLSLVFLRRIPLSPPTNTPPIAATGEP